MIKFRKKKIDKDVINKLQDILYSNSYLLDNCEFLKLYEIVRTKLRNSGVGVLTNVLIQAKIDFLKYMDEIPNQCFYDCTNLISIDLPNNMKSIGRGAFSGCNGLTSITIPNSVTSIDAAAFYGCTRLTSIIIPDGVTTIGGWMFYNCFQLIDITIPNSVTSIDDCAFLNCRNLENIVIPDSVINIYRTAFTYCKRLASITVSANVKSVEAFNDLHSLENITYKGTKSQWYEMLNGNPLIGVSKNCVIHCLDGDITNKR